MMMREREKEEQTKNGTIDDAALINFVLPSFSFRLQKHHNFSVIIVRINSQLSINSIREKRRWEKNKRNKNKNKIKL